MSDRVQVDHSVMGQLDTNWITSLHTLANLQRSQIKTTMVLYYNMNVSFLFSY